MWWVRSGEKSDLLKYLQRTAPQSHLPSISVAGLELSVLVNMSKSKKNQTFGNYFSEMLILQLQTFMTQEYDAQRMDVVFNTYKQVSLKSLARKKRGNAIQYKVQMNSIALTNWQAYLRIDKKKQNCLDFYLHTVYH